MLELKNVSFQAEDGGKEIEILRNINLTLRGSHGAERQREIHAGKDCGGYPYAHGGTNFPGRRRYHG